MKILCNGGNGYIASCITPKLEKEGHEVFPVDTRDYGYVEGFPNSRTLVQDYSKLTKEYIQLFDVIIHLAGSSSVPICNANPDLAHRTNVQDFIRLCNTITDEQVLIYASSACVYGFGDDFTEESRVSPTDALSFTKSYIDWYTRTALPHKKIYGIRPGSVSGWAPHFRTDLAINSMTISGLTNRIKLFNSENLRPFTSLEDLYHVISLCINQEVPPGIYNAVSFNSSFGKVAEHIRKILGCTIEFVAGEETYSFTMASCKLPKWEKQTLEEIVQTIVDSKDKKLITYDKELVNTIKRTPEYNLNWGKR